MKVLGFRFPVFIGAMILVLSLFLGDARTVYAQAGDGCAVVSDSHPLTAEQQRAVENLRTRMEAVPADMSCQNLSAGTSRDRCVSGLCPGGTDTMCCMPGTGASRGLGGEEPSAPAGGGGGGGVLRLQLPACVADGNCGLDDIVEVAVNFANFLFGISGAIFLAIFVYAGFKYIFFAAQSSEVSAAKGMLVNATIGIILMFGASALVTTVYNAFRAGGSGGDARCTAAFPANSCQPLSANWEDVTARNAEIRDRSCQPGLCGEDNRLVCCPTESSR